MPKKVKKHLTIASANLMFIAHCVVAVLILIGWIWPAYKVYYMILLVSWISSWIFLGYCPLTRWEFLLRKQHDKSIDINAEIIRYYLQKYFNKDIPSRSIFVGGITLFCLLFTLAIYV